MAAEPLMPVKVIRDVLIPMPDGVRLAGNLFLPEEHGQYPGILTYIPYLKDGPGRPASEACYRHFASRGYAVMRVDFRGTGNSEGVNPYPMDPQERADGHEIVEWMAAQPWCTGSVGVWGSSYGGITALSIASTRPPHLKAIIPLNATYDNYACFFMPDGCQGLLYCDYGWGAHMAASNLLPPLVPDIDGRWARMWRERLEANAPWLLSWHGEPPDTDFWMRRRIPYDQIDVPTFGICGWRDAYRGPTFTVYEAVNAPKRVLIGPWKHVLPDFSPVAPIGGIHEMDRWWDRWLKGLRNGVEDEPPITIYIRGADRWRHETEWPIARAEDHHLYLGPERTLARESNAAPSGQDAYTYDPRVGIGSLGYNGSPVTIPVPDDQGFDDLLSLAYTTPPFERDTEITGVPVARVYLSASIEETNLVAKLCVVEPTGRSQLITSGWLNTTRPSPHDVRDPLAPGEIREVAISLRPTSYVIKAGERLRLCLSGADFPELWPTPRPYEMQVYFDAAHPSQIMLPIVPPREAPLADPRISPAVAFAASPPTGQSRTSHQVQHDLINRTVSFETKAVVEYRIDAGATMRNEQHAVASTNANLPWLTNLRTRDRIVITRSNGDVTTLVETTLTPFDVHVSVEIAEAGQIIHRKSWAKDIQDCHDDHAR